MDDGDGAQGNEVCEKRGLLCGDDDTYTVVALKANRLQEGLVEGFCSGNLEHVL